MEKDTVFNNWECNRCRGDLYAIKLGGASVLSDVIKELEITRGAMLMDGYEENDSCIQFLDKSLLMFKNKYKEISDGISELSNTK